MKFAGLWTVDSVHGRIDTAGMVSTLRDGAIVSGEYNGEGTHTRPESAAASHAPRYLPKYPEAQ